MNNAEVLIKFKGDTSDADKAMSKAETSMGKLTKSFALANLAAQGVTKAIQVFNQNLDSAIRRVDTMNNFPKVMTNLGISAEDSSEVIQDLSDKLQGLPTTIDNAAMSVQRFTAYNGDIKKSEKYFLAMNNAVLAGTNNAQMQSAAIEQMTQAYTKGKPEMQDWKTLLQAIPAQLKQVAIAMGYPQTDKLYQALQNGEVSMNDFMDTLVQLNEVGVNGFASLEEQARANTDGISTSVTNMKTAITRGIASMLNSLNKALEPFGGISGVLAKIGKSGEEVFKKIGNAIAILLPKIINIIKWLKEHKTLVQVSTGVVASFFAVFKTASVISNTTKKITDFSKKVSTIKNVAQKSGTAINGFQATMKALNLTFLASPITWIIAGIVALVAAFVILWNKCEWFRQFWINMWNGIKEIFSTIVNFIKDNWKALLLILVNPLAGAFKLIYDNCEGFRNFINNFVDNVISFIKKIPDYLVYAVGYIIGLVAGLIVRLWEFIHSDIPAFFLEVLQKIADFFVSIGTSLWNFITVTIPNFIKNVIDKLKQLPGKVWEAVKEAPGKIAKAFIDGIQSVKDAVKKVFNAIWDGLKDLPKKLMELGKEMVKGIWEGIKSMGSWIKNKIKSFGSGIVDGFKSAFGIHSPSVILKKQVGINLGLGVVEGINATTKDINNAISDVAADVSMGVNAALNPGTINSMQTNNITPITNVYITQKQDPLGQLVQDVKTFSGGAKQDYLYGR